MSSAQEKVTGSGKLDLNGVMAALAMANKEEESRRGFGSKREEGRQSFLHGGWRQEEVKTRLETSSEVSQQAVRSSEGLAQFLNGLKGEKQRISDDPPSRKPSPPPIENNHNPLANQSFLHSIRQESQKSFGNQDSNKYNNSNNNSNSNIKPSSGGVAGRKAIFEASSSSSSFSSSCSNSSSPDTGKRMFSLPASPPRQEKTFPPPRLTQSPQARFGNQVEETGATGLADRKAKFEFDPTTEAVSS